MNYTFSAIYNDGKKVTLSDTVSYDSLVRNGINAFEVQKDEQPFILMKLDEGAKLIYRKRVEQNVAGDQYVVYLFGWRNGESQSMNYLSQDGVLVQGGQFDDKDSWMYSPKLREYEV